MPNIHSYFEINWEATAANVRRLMEGVISKETLAKSMCVTTRTVANWCRGKAHPSLDTLILLARFFNVDVLDIVVTNGQMERPIEREDYEKARGLAPYTDEGADRNRCRKKRRTQDETCEVRNSLIRNLYELCFTLLNVIIDPIKRKALWGAARDSSEHRIWRECFSFKKFNMTLENYEKKALGLETDSLLSNWRKEA